MGSFDKSYYDILGKYQDILKEGMSVKPIVYKRVGENQFAPATDLDLAMVPPELLYTKSDDPAQPYVPYKQANPNAQQPQQPSISVTGDSGPQTSRMSSGDTNEPVRTQYNTFDTVNTSAVKGPTAPQTSQQNTTSSSLPTNTSKPKTTQVTNTPTSKSKSSQVTNAPTSRSVNR
jgi:hypothetical protein